MLYFIIRPLVRLTFRIFFSKIHLHHLERIPKDRPVLIASNHPSAFLEACILATHFPKSLHFLVRGDIFVNKFVVWLLGQLHLTPIYRSADGFKNLRANDATFNECHRRLANNEIIVVYAEGNTTQEKRLRPLQKGLARIAFGAMDASPHLDLCIVPLGVNYTHPNDFRSEVYVEVGEPIELKEYYALYRQDALKSIQDLTQKVYQSMQPLVIHINKDEDLPLAEYLWSIQKAKTDLSFLPVIDRSGLRFDQDKKISTEINAMTDAEKQAALDLMNTHLGALPVRAPHTILAPIAWIGKILNFLPLWMGYTIAKAKVRRIEFFASVLVGTTMFLYLFYLLGVLCIGRWLGISPWFLLTAILLSGFIYIYNKFLEERTKAAELLKNVPKPAVLQPFS